MSSTLASQAASEIKGGERCTAYCYADLVRVCGEDPHPLCQKECAPVVEKCAGLVLGNSWLKSLAERLGLQLSFVQGTFSLGTPTAAAK